MTAGEFGALLVSMRIAGDYFCVSVAALTLLAVALTGCAHRSAKAGLAAETVALDSAPSSVELKIRFTGVPFTLGVFEDLAGALALDYRRPESSKARVTVQTRTVTCPHAIIRRDMKGPDFLHIEKYHTIEFVSTAARATDEPYTLALDAKLTLRGVTRPVTLELRRLPPFETTPDSPPRWETRFFIKRADFGMTKSLKLISDETEIRATLVGVQQPHSVPSQN